MTEQVIEEVETNLDLATYLAHKYYHLEEGDWTLTSFNDSAKSVSVGLAHYKGMKLRITFPLIEIVYERMRRWEHGEKVRYLNHLKLNEEELPLELEESFRLALNEVNAVEPSSKDEQPTKKVLKRK